MARIHTLSLLVYLLLHFLLETSHAYEHRHLRRTAVSQDQGHVVETAAGSRESVAKQQMVDELQRKLDEKLALRSSTILLLDREDSRMGKEKRWGGHRHHHHHDDDGNRGGDDSHSSAFEELQQRLDDLNQAIRSLYDLLSSSFGAISGSTMLSATATSISTKYNVTSSSASLTPIAYSTGVSSNTIPTATAASNSNHTIDPISSTSEPTTSTTARYAFDPMSSSNVAVYYGQTDQTSNVPLSTICADRDVDIIILAFVNKLSTGPVGYPGLNLGPHCWATSSAQVHEGATGLIDCVGDGFAEQVKSCQNTGKKVLLSIGGAIGYSETTIASEEDAVRIADNIWNLFGGGMDNDTITAIRPFGDVIFDGFDIDNEDSSVLHWPTLISNLRTHFSQQSSSSSNPNSKPYYLSAAPQCPRPDASIPLASMRSSIDFIFIQFYNNPSCNLDSAATFLSSLQAWSDDLSSSSSSSAFVHAGNGVSGPRLFVGAPSFPAAGSGWVGGEEFARVLGGVVGLGLGNLGGVMLWDAAYGALSGGGDGNGSYGRTYMGLAKDVLGLSI